MWRSVTVGASVQAATGGRWWGRIGSNCGQYRRPNGPGRPMGMGPAADRDEGQYRMPWRPNPFRALCARLKGGQDATQ
jgi:hypothetical protein